MMKAPKNPSTQPRLFQVIDMEDLVPAHHILRQINEAVDFSVIHDWVAPLYTEKTVRPAADPERLLRLMLLSYLFDHSERELYEILPMHAGYLWFCGLDFESVLHPDPYHPALPDRTTLVKTRKRWRQHGIFDRLMTYVVDQCIAAGLVSPDVHAAADGTQVRANASIHSLREVKLAPVETLEDYLARTAREDEQTESPDADRDPDDDPPSPSPKSGERVHAEERGNFRGIKFSNQTHRNVTDPDARLYKKGKGQEAYPRYLVHDVIDVQSRVILSRKAAWPPERRSGRRVWSSWLRFSFATRRLRFGPCLRTKRMAPPSIWKRSSFKASHRSCRCAARRWRRFQPGSAGRRIPLRKQSARRKSETFRFAIKRGSFSNRAAIDPFKPFARVVSMCSPKGRNVTGWTGPEAGAFTPWKNRRC